MKMFLYMKVKKMLIEVLNEIKLLRQLLENIGLSTIKYDTRCILDIKDLSDYFVSDTFIIRRDSWNVGDCSVYVLTDGSIAIQITVNPLDIPEIMVKQLLLLGFKNIPHGWLTYRIIIEDTTDDNSTESTG